MIEDTEKFIERFRYKATKAVQVQSRIKHLEKTERIEVDEEDFSSINLRFAPAPRSGTTVVDARELSKSFGHHMVLDKINFTVTRGEKVAFVGRNGEGKTTFSKIITGELDHTGFLRMGHNVKTGYFAQNQDELLDESKSVFQTIDDIATGDIRSRIRDMLGAFLFRGDEIEKKVKVLSGGERSRLALIRLLLEPYNLLVLDEPTNHLDMRSKDILKQALIRYDGTLIVVSHDRDFLDGLVSKVYEFRNNTIKEHIGGIYDFLKKKKLGNLRDIEIKEKNSSKEARTDELTTSKKRYLEKKEYEKNLRKMRKTLGESEEKIEKLEAELAELNRRLNEPSASDEPADKIYRRYEEVRITLELEMDRWTLCSHEMEEYLKSNDNE
jgi:ATP-binding cassette subfamily F protein 3